MPHQKCAAVVLLLANWLVPFCSLEAADLSPTPAALSLSIRGEERAIPEWEQEYLAHALERLYQGCQERSPHDFDEGELDRPNRLVIADGSDSRRVILAVGGSSEPFTRLELLYIEGGDAFRYDECQPAHLLPLVSIMEATDLRIEGSELRRSAGLTSYEPNRIGWTFDDNDVSEGYLDANLSLKYPFLHDGYYSSKGFDGGLYFAFTGRFSQYLESRDSSPVVGRRFNPKLFWRYWLGDSSRYIDLGLAHESNGQNINSEEAYLRAREDFLANGENPEWARDYISRGWDYLSFDWLHTMRDWSGELNTYVNLKYFLEDGPFQGEPEEYNDWEGDGVRQRKEYDGISLLAKYQFGGRYCLGGSGDTAARPALLDLCLQKAAWRYTTGYEGPGDHNTNRLEFTIDVWSFPLMLWGQWGYNSDLVDYYRKVNSWGIALELQSSASGIW